MKNIHHIPASHLLIIVAFREINSLMTDNIEGEKEGRKWGEDTYEDVCVGWGMGGGLCVDNIHVM